MALLRPGAGGLWWPDHPAGLLLREQHVGQIVPGRERVRVRRPEHSPPDLESLPLEPGSLRQLTLLTKHAGQVAGRAQCGEVLQPEHALLRLQRLAVQPGRLLQLALLPEHVGQVVGGAQRLRM